MSGFQCSNIRVRIELVKWNRTFVTARFICVKSTGTSETRYKIKQIYTCAKPSILTTGQLFKI